MGFPFALRTFNDTQPTQLLFKYITFQQLFRAYVRVRIAQNREGVFRLFFSTLASFLLCETTIQGPKAASVDSTFEMSRASVYASVEGGA